MKKNFCILILIIFITQTYCIAEENEYIYLVHLHKEAEYQKIWCDKNKGITEYKNDDKTRVDCLTKNHAVEFDFAQKWAESVGQALYYEYKTGKKAKVVLILENPEKEYIYYNRVISLSKIYNFDTEYVTPKIFELNKKERNYIKCKNIKKHRK